MSALLVVSLGAAACGNDDTVDLTGGSAEDYYRLSAQLDQATERPTDEQFDALVAAAPSEIADDVEVFVAAIKSEDGLDDPAGVDAAEGRILAWEEANCSHPDDGSDGDGGSGGNSSDQALADGPYCQLAREVNEQDDPPTVAQMTELKELAPAEIADPVESVTDALIPVRESIVDFLAVGAQDSVERGLARIDAFDAENCGIETEEDPPGAVRAIETDANRVDVIARDFEFEFGSVASGRTSFVLTNEGDEAHFLGIVRLAPGTSFQEAFEADDPSDLILGQWDTDLAAPDGEDMEVVTFDLEPGSYAFVCFLPTADGTPHALLGMVTELDVT